MDSFDYIITDLNNTISVFKSYALNHPVSGNSYSEFEDFFRSDILLNRTYHSCIITNFSPFFTLLPKNLYKASEKDLYLEQVAELGTRYQVDDERMSALGSVSVFAVHQFLMGWSKNRFKQHRKSHIINSLIKMAHLEEYQASPDRLFLYRSGHHMAVCLIKKGLLHFVNIFEIPIPEQLVYYIGLMISQFQLSQLDTKVYFVSGFDKGNDYYDSLKLYLPDVHTASLPKGITLAPNLKTAPKNQLLVPAVGLL